MVRGSLRQPAMAETPPDNRFKRTANHAGLTPSQQKARREGNPVRIQANLHQTDNAAKGWVKGEETGNYTTVFELGKTASETFESIEASINSSRLSETLQSAKPARTSHAFTCLSSDFSVLAIGGAARLWHP